MPSSFADQVVIITGSGAGVGKAYALYFAELGAKVVVNDLSADACQAVVAAIKQSAAGLLRSALDDSLAEHPGRADGGQAAASVRSVTEGHLVIQDAQRAFGGRVDCLINNAGILRKRERTILWRFSLTSVAFRRRQVVQEDV